MTAYPAGFSAREYDLARATALRADEHATRAAHAVRERRLARFLAGGVGVVGAIVTAVAIAAPLWGESPWSPFELLLGSGALPFATYAAARLALRVVRHASSERVLRGSARLESLALTVPLVATSLLAPLLIHALVFAVLWVANPETRTYAEISEAFTTWMRLSGMIVGHAHIALAICATLFVDRLRRASAEQLATLPAAKAGCRHVLVTAGIAAVPGIALLAIPPALVAVTGLAFVPFVYRLARVALLEERHVLALLDAPRNVTIGIAELEAARDSLAAAPGIG